MKGRLRLPTRAALRTPAGGAGRPRWTEREL